MQRQGHDPHLASHPIGSKFFLPFGLYGLLLSNIQEVKIFSKTISSIKDICFVSRMNGRISCFNPSIAIHFRPLEENSVTAFINTDNNETGEVRF